MSLVISLTDMLQDKRDMMLSANVACELLCTRELYLKTLRSKFTHVNVDENHMHEDLGMTWQTVHVFIHQECLI